MNHDPYTQPTSHPQARPGPAAAPAPEPAAPQSVIDILRVQKDARSGCLDTELPVSGLTASYPAFINHDAVLNAMKQAGKNRNRIGAVMIAQHCLIGGQRLTVSDITSLMHNDDVVHLTNLLLGDGGGDSNDEDGAGN